MRREIETSNDVDQAESPSPLASGLQPPPVSMIDAYAPAQIAERVCKIGLAKVSTPVLTMIALAVLAGAFISLGGLFYTVTVTIGKGGSEVPYGLLRLAGGV